MAGVQPTTILINENMSDSQIASFINQNFQTIANSFLTSAFKIVSAFTATTTSYTTGTVAVGKIATDVATFSFAHNLNFTPAVVAFIPSNAGINYYPLPRVVYVVSSDGIAYSVGNYQIYTTSTTVTIEITIVNSAIGSTNTLAANVAAQNVKVFLLQDKVA